MTQDQACQPGLLIVNLCFCSLASASNYSDDLHDIEPGAFGFRFNVGIGISEPTPIGDLGPIEAVVDLRGFVPMSFRAKSGRFKGSKGTWTELRWFKIPTRRALLFLYYGSVSRADISQDSAMLRHSVRK